MQANLIEKLRALNYASDLAMIGKELDCLKNDHSSSRFAKLRFADHDLSKANCQNFHFPYSSNP